MKELLIENMKQLATELGRTPTREMYCTHFNTTKRTILKNFETFTDLIESSDLIPTKNKTLDLVNTQCAYCDSELKLPNYQIKEKNFCSISCSNKIRKIDRSTKCENCNNIFDKTKDQLTNTCSTLCSMELGMKQKVMKDGVKRQRI